MTGVSKNTVVGFRYIMKDDRSNILENTLSGMPTRYLHGSDAISLVLQGQMSGMVVGEKRDISLSGASTESNGDYFFEIIIDTLRDATEQEIELGYPLENGNDDCPEDCECHQQN